MRKTLFITLISLLALTIGNSQTNISGGIYANTTWTLANSPYIVTDTVVVFPGVTLTIQPGVIVKFNNAVQLEIRQARLIAIGTHTDSITFTSNTSQTPSSWDEIILNGGTMTSKFNYCKFRYASKGLFVGGSTDSVIIKNSNFNYNTIGLYGGGAYEIVDTCNFTHNSSGTTTIGNAVLNYCNFLNNSSAIYDSQFSTINNCVIKNNGTGFGGGKANKINNSSINYNQTAISCGRGCSINNCTVIHNQSGIITGNTIHDDGVKIKNTTVDSNAVVGIEISNRGDSIFSCQIKYNGVGMIDNNGDNSWPTFITQNRIENNSIGLQLVFTSDNIYCNKICNNTSYDLKYSGTNNFTIANNYWCTTDSASISALIYDGYDNTNLGLVNFMPLDTSCYLTIPTTGINNYESPVFSFDIFPNPVSDFLTVILPTNISKSIIKIYNIIGELKYSSTQTKQKTDIDVTTLTSGIYMIQIVTGERIGMQKFIKQ